MLALTPVRLLFLQSLAHAGLGFWLLNQPSLQEAGLVAAMYFAMGCLGMSCTYHRLLTHRAYRTHKVIEVFGTLCGTLSLTGSSISWTAAHRTHHAKTDAPGDPHSPGILGYFWSQWLSMFSPINIKRSPVLRDPVHLFLHKRYVSINLLFFAALWALFGFRLAVVLHLVPAAILWNMGSLINTVCHSPSLGYQNFLIPNASINNVFLGLLVWGEGWHNNHHKNQTAASFSHCWWEVDVSYQIIKVIRIKA